MRHHRFEFLFGLVVDQVILLGHQMILRRHPILRHHDDRCGVCGIHARRG
jgi:hypothetical protein